jgi:hypothetical protein
MRLRYFIFSSKLTDSFEMFENMLPKIFYKYVGFHDLSMPLLYTLSDHKTHFSHKFIMDPSNKDLMIQPHPLTLPLETAMKTFFTAVISDEVYLPGQAKAGSAGEKEKTIFNKNSNLINEILDYKTKPPSIGVQSFDTFGKATVGTKESKESIHSKKEE